MENKKKTKISFAVFTFNQEEYIKHAIDGALSQHYDNLEIIISDDASTDNTVEVIKEYIESYNGPHRIIINVNEINIGTVAHMKQVANIATGEVLVMSAGDDISLPNRVSEIAKIWQEQQPGAIISDYQLIDENGTVVNEHYNPHHFNKLGSILCGSDELYSIHGASSAYDINIIRNAPNLVSKYLFEDLFMSVVNCFEGETVYRIPDSLVKYRQHSNSISNRVKSSLSIDDDKRSEIKSSDYHKNKVMMQKELYDFYIDKKGISTLNKKRILDSIEPELLKVDWYKSDFFSRIMKISKVKDIKILVWMVKRVFGLNSFVFLKKLKIKN